MSAHTARAIARLCITYCTALPLQRYGLLGALALIALGLPAAALSPAPAVIALTLATMLAVATLLPVGWVFRQLSARRAYRFAPHFRLRMLAALGIVAAAPSLVSVLVLSFAPREPALLPALVYPALYTSMLIWLLFFVPVSLLIPLVVLALLQVLRRADQNAVEAFLAGPGAVICAVFLVAAWALFAAWYLRAARVGPFGDPLLALLDGSRRRNTALPAVVTSADALRMHLWPRLRPRPAHAMLAASAVIALVLALVVELDPRPTLGVPVLVLTMLTFVPGRQATYRARLAWLKAPLSRRQLFAVAERGLFRLHAQVGLAIAVGLGGALALRGLPLRDLVPLLVLAASTGTLGGYLGLMSTRAARWPELALSGAYVASVAWGAALFVTEAGPDRLVPLLAAQLAAAAACRAIALRRWETIDWLEARPPRRDSIEDALQLVR